jgi:hypothetical protein
MSDDIAIRLPVLGHYQHSANSTGLTMACEFLRTTKPQTLATLAAHPERLKIRLTPRENLKH